ncbi:MAG: hypothetical protein AABX88_01900 [Nanoarchaeota archaeon]
MTFKELILRPEFWDLFGLPIFILITGLSFWMLKYKRVPPKWVILGVMTIGILGAIVDGFMIYFQWFG